MDLSTWIHSLTDVGSLLSAVGPWTLEVIAVMVFVESGLLFPFLPGDSLLVAATIARGGLGISAWQVILVASLAAVAWFVPGLMEAVILGKDRCHECTEKVSR